MSFKKMPPQAYTKETLQEAFEWWNQQPEDFRDKVQDKDDLVGYYLKVRRGYSDSEVSDVAKASFSSELRGLAKNLDDFEGYQPPTAQAQESTVVKKKPLNFSPTPSAPSAPTQEVSFPSFEAAKVEPSVQLKFPDMTKSPVVADNFDLDPSVKKSLTLKATTESHHQQKSLVADSKYFKLDAKSAEYVSQVRKALNLSSDQEALRAIVALGASKLSSLLNS